MRDGPAQNLDTEAGRVLKVQRGGTVFLWTKSADAVFSTDPLHS